MPRHRGDQGFAGQHHLRLPLHGGFEPFGTVVDDPKAVIGFPEVQLGLLPGARWPRQQVELGGEWNDSFEVARNAIVHLRTLNMPTVLPLGIVTMVGTWTYGVSFLVNGPLTDRFGGRRTMLWAAAGFVAGAVLMRLWAAWAV